ncbi:hypothetical protein AALP_AA1G316600 [Arabis alpina]|uniref:Uncharacterized protein n=1 Tax=Arabis alpina TaxID=50452 RepID=A0A087HRZ1_ARAAL|nr:hypothetical protein AALP_AA1G316600 [Arabis alpina]
MQFLARTLSNSIRSSLASRSKQSWVLSHRIHSTSSLKSSFTRGGGNRAPKKSSSEWPRPTEIPYQPKIANSIDLVGYVKQPVQFHANQDGSSWAGTVISHKPSSDSDTESDTKFLIPVLFEGELAHTANCHLKENDRVHITGQVFVDTSPSGEKPDQEYVQVMVRDLHYIEGSKALPKVLPISDQKEGVLKHSASLQQVRNRNVGSGHWFDLLDKSDEWCDYRESKQNGSVHPKYPDFKKKDGSVALWLNNAPKEILFELEDVKFDIPVKSTYTKQPKAGEESWKDLVGNMSNWWDNRLIKKNVKAPDFKHKDTGVVIWLSDCPSWVIEKLPPPKEPKASDTATWK